MTRGHDDARDVSGEARRLLATLARTQAAIDAWDAEMTGPTHHEEAYRRDAEALRALGEPTRAALVEALGHSEIGVRREAARALGRLGGRAGTVPLLDALRDADDELRRAAAGALGRIADPAAAAELRRALDDASESVRGTSAEALASSDPKAVCAVLEEPDALERYPRGVLACFAARLGAIDDPRAPALLADLARLKDPTVRARAMESLAPILDARPGLAERLLRPRLRGACDEGAAELAREIARHGGSVIAVAGPLVASSRSFQAGALAAQALGRAVLADGPEALERALRSPSEHVRRAAIEAFGRAHLPVDLRPAFAVLVAQALADPSRRVVESAANASRGWAEPEVVDALTRTIAHRTSASELTALDPLRRELGARAAPAALDVLARDARPDVRARAVRLLAPLDAPGVHDALWHALQEGAAEVRAAAARALAGRGETRVFPFLVAALEAHREVGFVDVAPARGADDDRALAAERVVTLALQDIGRTRHEDAFALLADHAERSLARPPDARGMLPRATYYRLLGALKGLGHLGDPRALPLVRRAFEHPDFRLRRDMVEVLVELADPEAEALLRRALEDPHHQVREAARRAPERRSG